MTIVMSAESNTSIENKLMFLDMNIMYNSHKIY